MGRKFVGNECYDTHLVAISLNRYTIKENYFVIRVILLNRYTIKENCLVINEIRNNRNNYCNNIREYKQRITMIPDGINDY